MKKWNRKDYLYVFLLNVLFISLVIILTKGGYLYGSRTDWLTQHVTIPEYLRNLFYQTHQLFPNFAPHLGGGVNIYYLSYYGLWNPIILLSYLFPKVSMLTYIQTTSILLTMLSITLFYYWIRKKYSSNVTFLATFLFLGACPITFHSHRHLMFVNYIPFLILALNGVERYFEKRKSGLLIVSIFLIIMCSYFYSVGAILCIVIYGIYYYLKNNDLTLKGFIKDGLRFCLPILTSILLAMFLLLPTLYVILTGRNDTNVSIDWANLLLPNLYAKYALYKSYGMGLTSFFIFTLCVWFQNKDKSQIFLASVFGILLTFPIFIYFLNGGMYLDSKVLIPFVPLACFMSADTLNQLFKQGLDFKTMLLFLTVGILILITGKVNLTFFVIDMSLLLVSLLFIKKKWIFTLVLLGTATFNCLQSNFSDNLIEKKEFNPNQDVTKISENWQSNNRNYRVNDTFDHLYKINKVHNMDEYKTSIYSSTVPLDYQNFYFHTFLNANPNRNLSMMGDNKNIFFQYYMGSRYAISQDEPMIGYEQTEKGIYENKDVYPIGYVNYQTMSEQQFKSLPYPDNIEALLKYSVVQNQNEVEYESHMQPITLDYQLVSKNRLQINEKEDMTIIKSNGLGWMNVKIDNPLEYKILVLQFRILKDQSCKKGDMSITINDVRNVLTCRTWKYHNQNFVFNYVISANTPITNLHLDFAEGEYQIVDSKVYGFDYSYLQTNRQEITELKLDYNQSKGDKLVGKVDVKKDNGYFQLSVPYDPGFEIKVDGQNQIYQKVDTTFIGFPIEKGSHEIVISYKAPMRKIATFITIIGLILFVIQLSLEKKFDNI